MEEYQGVKWASQNELTDLLEKGVVEGPFDAQHIEQREGFIRRGMTLCYREAARISLKKEYDFAVASNSTELGRKGSVDVEFYRFKNA